MADRYQFIISPSDIGAGKKGAAEGPDSLLKALNSNAKSNAKNFPVIYSRAPQSVAQEQEHTFARHIEELVPVMQKLAEVTRISLENGKFPIILSGDHSNAIGSISGFRDYFNSEKIGVVWIDAHYDLHSPYTTPSGNLHGMSLNALLGDDNTVNQIHQPDQSTMRYWNELKSIGNPKLNPKISSGCVCFIGVRDFEPQEQKLADKAGFNNTTVAEARRSGMAESALNILQRLNECNAIYVSFDVDSMDPQVSAATGTPVPGGFTASEAQILLKSLLHDNRVKALEITEINPRLESDNKMSETVADILSNLF